MRDLIEVVLQVGLAMVAGADRIMMGEARIRRLALELGVDLSIPQMKIREVSDFMREEIIAARARVSDNEWLRSNGPRDQLCMALGLTTEQVAGVLAGSTRRTNGNGGGERLPEVVVEDPQPAVPELETTQEVQVVEPAEQRATSREQAITHEVDTWPVRSSKNGADRPPRGHKEYEIDETDYQIVRAVLRHGSDEYYQQVREQIAIRRRLTGQQVAGIKASITSKGD